MSEREDSIAQAYAERLLASLGRQAEAPRALPMAHPALRWSRSGLMALTGTPESPLMFPAPLAACADGALAALAALGPVGALEGIEGAALLGERAAIAGHQRGGAVSPGGACRLLQAADGWLALNLARDDDWELLPAWLEAELPPGWEGLAAVVRERAVAPLIEQGRLLGLALADARPLADAPPWQRGFAAMAPVTSSRPPRVLDLSSLWAGPLCGHLLHRLGANVVKMESSQRPDGARNGPPAFFDLMNAGKRSVALDLRSDESRAQLRRLIAAADIVIEASRPRALRQMGFDAEALAREHRLTWISLSGYGRGEPQEQWIAYGDDAAVAAGLSDTLHRATGQALIVGDAIADPLTGLHAALAAWAGWQAGGGMLVSLALSDVVRHCLQFDLPAGEDALRVRQHEWTERATADGGARLPRARTARGAAPALGAHTADVIAEWAAC